MNIKFLLLRGPHTVDALPDIAAGIAGCDIVFLEAITKESEYLQIWNELNLLSTPAGAALYKDKEATFQQSLWLRLTWLVRGKNIYFIPVDLVLDEDEYNNHLDEYLPFYDIDVVIAKISEDPTVRYSVTADAVARDARVILKRDALIMGQVERFLKLNLNLHDGKALQERDHIKVALVTGSSHFLGDTFRIEGLDITPSTVEKIVYDKKLLSNISRNPASELLHAVVRAGGEKPSHKQIDYMWYRMLLDEARAGDSTPVKTGSAMSKIMSPDLIDTDYIDIPDIQSIDEVELSNKVEHLIKQLWPSK